MQLKTFISGCRDLVLSPDERAFFRDQKPCGLILFDRNCSEPDQLRRLIDDFRETVGEEELLVLVDQEGGRIRRLKPPHWRAFPAAAAFGALYQKDPELGLEAAHQGARLLAGELRTQGINVNCVPVLDIPAKDAHEIIGDRAYGHDVGTVTALGRAVADGHLAGGVLPVMKHIPGHGRANADSHEDLPVINAAIDELEVFDFAAFRALNHLPLAMTAHVLIPQIDADEPASTSLRIIGQVIREKIGFDGLLMCDDLGMGALSGEMGARARRVMAAGCDIALHCNGELDEMKAVAAAVPVIDGACVRRYRKAVGHLSRQSDFDAAKAEALLARVVA